MSNKRLDKADPVRAERRSAGERWASGRRPEVESVRAGYYLARGRLGIRLGEAAAENI